MLRVVAGGLIFYIHGWHKLEEGVAYVRSGTPWRLAEEIAEMHFPFPLVSAFAATAVQFFCAPMFAVGFLTRINAAVLTGVLSVAILQNHLANRDPQLAILYTVIVAAFVLIGGGRHSVDAKLTR